MAEGLAALGAAAVVAQCLDIGARLVGQSKELYDSASGQTQIHKELDLVADDLESVCQELQTTHSQTLAAPQSSDAAQVCKLAQHAEQLAQEFRKAILSLKASSRHRVIESIHLALKGLWTQKKLQAYQAGLSELRAQLTLHLTTILSKQQEDLRGYVRHVPHLRDDLLSLQSHLKQHHADLPVDLERRLQRIVHGWQQSAAYAGVLQSLVYPEIVARESTIPEAHKKTFQWALRDGVKSGARLMPWLRSESGTYWVTGLPGAGKSTFIKYIYEAPITRAALREWSGSRPLITARYFFWTGGTEIQRSQEGLCRSLLYDVFSKRPDLIPTAVSPSRWTAKIEEWHVKQPWTIVELLDTLRCVVRDVDSHLCFFIDGLDEYDGDHHQVVRLVAELCAPPNVKVCLASRDLNVFRDAFGKDERRRLKLT